EAVGAQRAEEDDADERDERGGGRRFGGVGDARLRIERARGDRECLGGRERGAERGGGAAAAVAHHRRRQRDGIAVGGDVERAGGDERARSGGGGAGDAGERRGGRDHGQDREDEH